MAKSSKKPALGKGLDSILNPEGSSDKFESRKRSLDSVGNIINLSPSQIHLNPNQPRKDFDTTSLSELSNSIETYGLIQPITVRKVPKKNIYQLISGERRLRAAKQANLRTIPAYVRSAKDQEILKLALIENIHRKDLNPIEIGLSYFRLTSELGITHAQLSEAISKNRSSITNYIRLLKLPDKIQIALQKEIISYGHGRALVSVGDSDTQIDIFEKIIARELSVRATEDLIKQLGLLRSKTSSYINPLVETVQKDLSDMLHCPVMLKINQKGTGYIKVPFTSEDKLNDILERIKGDN